MPISIDIQGIALAEGPLNSNKNRGRLDLPPDFPTGRYSCKWVKRGPSAIKAQQKESIVIDRRVYNVDGWSVYKHPVTKKFHTRTLGNGQYLLMVRPLQLQTTLQRLNGNASRKKMESEVVGETVGGKSNDDYGMLTHKILARIPGLGEEGSSPERIVYNDLVDEETQAPNTVKVAKLKSKIKR